jgi:ABC-type protease/lipase transport system fused ATPase/permease subunit
VGPNGSGKSSVLRAVVGAWTPARGVVRLDRIDLRQWNSDALGQHIGYLPQDVELLSGTIAQNIARFEPDADPQKIVAAARTAGVHNLIAMLPDGYNMDVGHNGNSLSAGQRQRIGLARALYGDPFLIALDEPMSNLDVEGIQALNQAIAEMRTRGRIVIMIAHGPSALVQMDLVLVMGQGRAAAFGPKEAVLRRGTPPAASPLRVVPEGGGTS